MPYFEKTGKDSIVLLLGIFFLIILVIVSFLMINLKCKNRKIKKYFYIGLFIQILILIIDNYVIAFPTIDIDSRGFEGYGWISFEENINIGKGAYNDFIINPIYKLLQIRVALLFGAINIFLHILINLNLLEILKMLKINKKLTNFLIGMAILSPITLITRAGILREAFIVYFITCSLKYFIISILNKNNLKLLFSFIYIGIATLFHGGVIFVASGYLLSLLSGKKNQKIYQIVILMLIAVIFFIFKDRLLMKIGGGDLDKVVQIGNSQSLREAGSAYLQGVDMGNLPKLILYLPLKIFYFLFSPTPDMIRGVIDIGVFCTNSLIFIFLVFNIIKLKRKIKIIGKEKNILNYLSVSLIITIVVFSIGTHNAGTAMRHRDKIMIIFIIIYGILKNRELKNVFRKNICKSTNMDTRDYD